MLAGIGYAIVGALVGAMSLLIFPTSLVGSGRFRGASLIVTPLLVGSTMWLLGRWRRQQDKPSTRLATFWYGFIFAFLMALVRFLWARPAM